MERKEITKAIEGCDEMATLRDAAAALEPIVGEAVKGTSKDSLREAIEAALDKAEASLSYVDACNALAPLFGWAKVEPADEVEAREQLEKSATESGAPSSDVESDNADNAGGKVDDGEGVDSAPADAVLILVRANPFRIPAYVNDVVINPTPKMLMFQHARITPEKARHVVSSYGRLNRDPAVSTSPELTLEDLG